VIIYILNGLFTKRITREALPRWFMKPPTMASYEVLTDLDNQWDNMDTILKFKGQFGSRIRRGEEGRILMEGRYFN